MANLLRKYGVVAGLLPALGMVTGNAEAQFIYKNAELIQVTGIGESTSQFLYDNSIYSERWDTLAQPHFWRQVIRLSPDSALINIASTRQIVGKVSLAEWNRQSELEKETFRQKTREHHGYDANARVLVTSGKNHFYRFENALPHLGNAIRIFNSEGTNPWFAQAIMLIESPASMQKSNVGAHGHFQLMPDVARMMGLTVNRSKDERLDFDKSAAAAARFIKQVCVPHANAILERHNICDYSGDELWYKLLVMHVYHAGAGNVGKAVDVIQPTAGNINLIRSLWKTEAGGFRNASQNYSQIALASMMELYDLVYSQCESTCEVK